jgi:hypothetical protein
MKTAAVVADFGKHKTNYCDTSINLRSDNPYNESLYIQTVREAATWRRYDYPWTDQRLALIQRHKKSKSYNERSGIKQTPAQPEKFSGPNL